MALFLVQILMGMFTAHYAVEAEGFYGIPLFYSVGLAYSNHTPLSIAEYWRWWAIHLWIEGFFEVFATVVTAYLCSELGFLKKSSALRATYLTTILYLGSGVIVTLHHLHTISDRI